MKLLVVVDNFDIYGTLCSPAEADAVLVIDADGVLPFATAAQRL